MKKKKQRSDNSQKAVANDALFALLRDGKLPVTKKNADFVKMKYCEAVSWNQVFKSAGLEYLEDPEKEHDEPMFERWLASAFRDNFGSDDEAMAAIKSVRTAVLANL